MKIFTKPFRENAKILNSVLVKNHQVYESVYFNFSDSYAYFSNPNLNLRISFIFELQPEKNETMEKLNNFLVPFEKFQILCNLYQNYIEFDLNDNAFHFGEESYKFSVLKEDLDVTNFDKFKNIVDDNSGNVVKLNNKSCDIFSRAIKYAESDNLSADVAGVFIRKGGIIATDKCKFYEEPISDTDISIDLDLPVSVSKILASNSDLDNISIFATDNHICIKLGDEIDLISAKSKNLNIPDIHAPNFIQVYDHPTKIVFDRRLLIDNLKLLTPFLREAPKTRIYLEVKENELVINVKDENLVTKVIKLKEVSSELIGRKFWISQAMLLGALMDFVEDDIEIRISVNPNAPIVNILASSNPKKDSNYINKHVMIALIKE